MVKIAKSSIEKLVENNQLIRKIKEGETTLEQELNELEKGFFELEKKLGMFKITKEVEEEAKSYGDRASDFACAVRELEQFGADLLGLGINWEPRLDIKNFIADKKQSNKSKKWALTASIAPLLSLPLSLVSPFMGVLYVLISSGLVDPIIQQAVYNRSNVLGSKNEIVEYFMKTRNKAKEIDQQIHSHYILNYYKKSTEEAKLVKYKTKTAALFMETFRKSDDKEQFRIIKELLAMENNPQVDPWLEENYTKLVETAGMERYLG